MGIRLQQKYFYIFYKQAAQKKEIMNSINTKWVKRAWKKIISVIVISGIIFYQKVGIHM